MTNKYFIIPIFVPHLGCPHDCVFCNQKRITGLSTNVEKKDVKRIIDEHLETFPEGDKTVEVAFFGGSFTAIDRDIQEELLSLPFSYKEQGLIDAIRLSTRPDYIDHDILKLLKNYGVDTIELGVQSMDEDVLFKSGRGHDVESVYRASDLIKSYDINLGLQMMLGLVGDSYEKSLNTCRELIKLEPYCVRIYPTLVIRDTYLEKLYNESSYKALSLDQAVEYVKDYLMLFESEAIDVIRVGLQPTENIQMGKDVIAGPFHPSFRQLVESSIIRSALEAKFLEEDIKEEDLVKLYANGKNISNISGQKKINSQKLKEEFDIKNIKIYAEDRDLDEIRIESEKGNFLLSIKEYREDYLIKNQLV